MPKNGKRRGRGTLAAVFIALLLAALIPVGAIFLHERWAQGLPPDDGAQALQQGPAALPLPESRPEPRPPASSPQEPSGPSADPEPPLPCFGLVEKGEAVAPDYFDDAVFFGDSLTEGFGVYSVLQNASFIASTGVNPDSVFTKEAITLPGEEQRLTMFQALGRTRPGKIYIMLGANWVGVNTGIEKETFLHHYRAMLEKILEQQPQAAVYIQSMLPVSKEYEENTNGNNRVGLTNAIINDYNAALCALAEELQLYYLDIHSAMVDETGCLPGEQTSDGMHLTPDYYARWYEYLLTHTAPAQEQEDQGNRQRPGGESAGGRQGQAGEADRQQGDAQIQEETASLLS